MWFIKKLFDLFFDLLRFGKNFYLFLPLIFFVFFSCYFCNKASAQIIDGVYDPNYDKVLERDFEDDNSIDIDDDKDADIKLASHELENLEKLISSLPIKLQQNYLDRLVRIGNGTIVKRWIENNENSELLIHPWRDYLEALIAYYRNKDLSALPKLRKIVIDNQSFWRARLSLAEIYYELNNFDAALYHYENLLKQRNIYSVDKVLISTRLRNLQKIQKFSSGASFELLNKVDPLNDDFNFFYYIDNPNLEASGLGVRSNLNFKFAPISSKSLDFIIGLNLAANNYTNDIYDQYYWGIRTSLRFKNESYNHFYIFIENGKTYIDSTNTNNIQQYGFSLQQYLNNSFLIKFDVEASFRNNFFNNIFDEDRYYSRLSYTFLPHGRFADYATKSEVYINYELIDSDLPFRSWREVAVGIDNIYEKEADTYYFYGFNIGYTKYDNQRKYLANNGNKVATNFTFGIQKNDLLFFSLVPRFYLETGLSYGAFDENLNTKLDFGLELTQRY